jgi:hypothetical protein
MGDLGAYLEFLSGLDPGATKGDEPVHVELNPVEYIVPCRLTAVAGIRPVSEDWSGLRQAQSPRASD